MIHELHIKSTDFEPELRLKIKIYRFKLIFDEDFESKGSGLFDSTRGRLAPTVKNPLHSRSLVGGFAAAKQPDVP